MRGPSHLKRITQGRAWSDAGFGGYRGLLIRPIGSADRAYGRRLIREILGPDGVFPVEAPGIALKPRRDRVDFAR